MKGRWVYMAEDWQESMNAQVAGAINEKSGRIAEETVAKANKLLEAEVFRIKEQLYGRKYAEENPAQAILKASTFGQIKKIANPKLAGRLASDRQDREPPVPQQNIDSSASDAPAAGEGA